MAGRRARDLGRLNSCGCISDNDASETRAPHHARRRIAFEATRRVLRERVSRAPVDPKVTSSPPDPASARQISVRARGFGTVVLGDVDRHGYELMEAPVEGAVEEWQEGMEAAGPLPLQTLEVRVLALYARATLDHAHPRGTRQSRHPPSKIFR